MAIKALRDTVVIEQYKEEEKSKGGIVIAEVAKQRPSEGTVINVGRDVKEVKPGDHVIFVKFAGTEVEAARGKKLLIMVERDILGIIK